MAERLIVRDFGPIKDIDLELKQVMVFIGLQASGKSTIAKLIAIFRSWGFVFNNNPFSDLLKHYNILSFKTEKTYIKFISDSYTFELLNGMENFLKNENHNFHITQRRYNEQQASGLKNIDLMTKQSELMANLNTIKRQLDEASKNVETVRFDQLRKQYSDIEVELNQIVAYQSIRSQYVDEALKLENYSEYIPAERIFFAIASGSFLNLINNKVPLPQNLLSFGAEVEKARNQLKEIDIDFLGAKYKFENNEDRVYFNKTEYVRFSESASGFQTIIPLLLIVGYKSKIDPFGHTFIIEEPELNLFPLTQKELTRILIEKCTSKKTLNINELVITTHSPYVLATLNNQLLANKVAIKKQHSNLQEIDAIIPRKYWIDIERFNAYSVKDGVVKNIIDNETQLISETELDYTSEVINNEFDALMDIYSKQDNASSNSKIFS